MPGMGDHNIRAQTLGQPNTAEARRFQQKQQSNAVSYSTPLPDWHAWKWSGDGWSEDEQDALTAVLLAQKGPPNMIAMAPAGRDGPFDALGSVVPQNAPSGSCTNWERGLKPVTLVTLPRLLTTVNVWAVPVALTHARPVATAQSTRERQSDAVKAVAV